MAANKKTDEMPARTGEAWWRRFRNWQDDVPPLLAASGLAAAVAHQRRIIIKPNLVEPVPPPITTPVALVAALVAYLREVAPHAELVVAEGVGSLRHDTWHVFRELGYLDLARRQGVELVDLNDAPLVRLVDPTCLRWPEMYLPAMVFDAFLISVPVLKAHSLAGVTLTMKNMMGLAPPAHYQQGGHWKKASFHHRVQEAVHDLNRYRAPDFTLLDATVGMAEAHLWGPTCQPPVNRLIAGFDPVAVDAIGAGLLGQDWRRIGHIRLGDGVLGSATATAVEVA